MLYKIVNLKRLKKHSNMWSFNLSMGGFLWNGFVYVEPDPTQDKKASIMVPTLASKRRLCRAHGIQFKRMLAVVEEEIKNQTLV